MSSCYNAAPLLLMMLAIVRN